MPFVSESPFIYAGIHPAKRKELAEQYLEKGRAPFSHAPFAFRASGQKQRVHTRSSGQSARHRLSR